MRNLSKADMNFLMGNGPTVVTSVAKVRRLTQRKTREINSPELQTPSPASCYLRTICEGMTAFAIVGAPFLFCWGYYAVTGLLLNFNALERF